MKQVSRFDIDDFVDKDDISLTILTNQPSESTKAALSDYTQFCDLVYRKVLKHVTTCWLSLNTCVNHILSGYEGLKSYFLSEDDEDSKIPRFGRLRNHFENPTTEIYLMFFQAVIPTFTTVIEFLQRGEPVISRWGGSDLSFRFRRSEALLEVTISLEVLLSTSIMLMFGSFHFA